MSDETESMVRVDFGKPVPLFPLDQVVLMPHQVCPLHIFEDRYRDMVSDSLDASGQIAMGVHDPRVPTRDPARPPVRPAVCLGQIAQHFKLPDGRYNIAIQGICRAQIVYELPESDERLYRLAMLEPLGPVQPDEDLLTPERERIREMLESDPLSELRDADTVAEHMADERIPTSVLLELLTWSFVSDDEQRYQLLAAGEPEQRARILRKELEHLGKLIKLAAPQRDADEPKGCHWN